MPGDALIKKRVAELSFKAGKTPEQWLISTFNEGGLSAIAKALECGKGSASYQLLLHGIVVKKKARLR